MTMKSALPSTAYLRAGSLGGGEPPPERDIWRVYHENDPEDPLFKFAWEFELVISR
ncbi:hypothetical protein J2129_001735 [Methanofollis sp. W23]|nr:hypothetical protein [Methanofollis sp. W23]